MITVLLSPAISAHPLLTTRELARLQKRWDGPVLFSRTSEHDLHMAGRDIDPRNLGSRVLTERKLQDMVIVHDEHLPLGDLLTDHPKAQVSMAVVDADAYTAEALLAAVRIEVGEEVEPW